MLICQTCHKQNATVHRIDVHWDGDEPQVAEANLCTGCAKTSGIPVQNPPSFSSVLGMLSKAFLPKEGAAAAGEADPTGAPGPECPECGWTLRDLRQTSRLGCPHDYEVFGEQLDEILERMHGHSSHADRSEDSVLDRLALELDQAVAQEDYETAARLRDDIRRLEADPGQDSASDPSSDPAGRTDNAKG